MRDRTLAHALIEIGETASWNWDKLPAQEAFLTSPDTFTVFSGGFGSGKTTALCAKLILMMTAIPNNLGLLGRLDGKALKASTLEVLMEMLPKEYIAKKNDQQGLLRLVPEVGGSALIYGDFKDLNDLKNVPLGFYAIDQMEEVPESVWVYLAGRIRRRTAVLTDDGLRQYYVKGSCAGNTVDPRGRHYALVGIEQDATCRLCGQALPPFSSIQPDGEDYPPWDLIIYNRYGFGVCNPEGPSHWIFKYFTGLPGQHGVSQGKSDHTAYHATIYDGLRAGFIDTKYVKNLENIYATSKTMWDRYLLGRWVEAEGLVYPGWNRATHVIRYTDLRHSGEPLIRPDRGHLFEYIDHGLTAATAVGWVYTDHCDCGCGKINYYLVDEHYEGGKVASYHSAQIKAHRVRLGSLPIQATYLDSTAFGKTLMGQKGTKRQDELYSVADEYGDYDIWAIPNQKDWQVGYNRISELLLTDPTHHHPITGERGSPHFLVMNTCTEFITEIERYKWRIVKNAVEPARDEPADGHDHHMDGLNGFLASRPADVVEFTPPKPDNLEWELAGWENPVSHMSA